MNRYNIVFMGTPGFAVPTLSALNTHHNVQAVICQPDRVNRRGNKVSYNPVKKYSLDNELPVYQPENINSAESEKYIRELNPDFIIVVAYGQFINKNIREIPKEKIVNIHASLLPMYRGAAPIHRAIMDRQSETGVTIMEVTKGMDMGDVYLESRTTVGDKTLEDLHDELSDMGSELILEYLKLYSEGKITATPQDESLATYAKKVSRADGIISFESVDEAMGQIKGLYPRPGASINYDGQLVRVLNGYIYSRESKEERPGDILSVDSDGMLVNAADGTLMITKVQFPNSRAMDIKDYILGNTIDKDINLRSD